MPCAAKWSAINMALSENDLNNSYLVLAGIFALGEPHDRLLSGDGHHKVGPALATVPSH